MTDTFPLRLSAAARARLVAEEHALTERYALWTAQRPEPGGDLADQAATIVPTIEVEALELRLRRVRELLASAPPADQPDVGRRGDVVAVGSIVTLRFAGGSVETYQVGSLDLADADLDTLTPTSPLGAALLGRTVGSVVEYTAPSGPARVEVLSLGDELAATA